MSINRSKLYKLINLISEDKLEEVIVILKDYIEKRDQDNLFLELFNNSIKVKTITKCSRQELHEK